MTEVAFAFITGMMLGIEFPNTEEIEEDVSFMMVIDLFVIRVVITKYILAD